MPTNYNFNLIKSKSNSTINSNINITTSCNNGCPQNKYEGYGVNASDVLYSVMRSYQNTFTPNWIDNNNSVVTNEENSTNTNNTNNNGPKNIFIIRHGEKSPSYYLDCNGLYRASKMADFINNLGINGYPISYIVTSNPCPLTTCNASMRPMQTVQFASALLNIPMFVYSMDNTTNSAIDNTAPLNQGLIATANAVTNNNYFNGTNVLICWEHKNIQTLANSLISNAITLNRINYTNLNDYWSNQSYCPGGEPPHWSKHNFDNVYWFNCYNNFDFNIFTENINTCIPSKEGIDCEIQTGTGCWC